MKQRETAKKPGPIKKKKPTTTTIIGVEPRFEKPVTRPKTSRTIKIVGRLALHRPIGKRTPTTPKAPAGVAPGTPTATAEPASANSRKKTAGAVNENGAVGQIVRPPECSPSADDYDLGKPALPARRDTASVAREDEAVPEADCVSEAAELGRQIGASWRKATAQILDVAELCDLAFRRYALRGLTTVLRAAQMSRPTFVKFVVIGRDQRLRQIEALLPPAFSIIYAVSHLSDAVLDEAVKAGVIHPNVRRAEIEALRKPKEKVTKQAAELPAMAMEIAAGGHYELMLPKDVGADHCAQIRQILHGLQNKFGVKIVSIKPLETASKVIVTPGDPSEKFTGEQSSPSGELRG